MTEYKTIDEYIAEFPEETQLVLEKVRQVIRKNAPDAAEKISYRMPCFWMEKDLIYFAAMKGHLGIYPTNSGIGAFADRLTEYKTSKGTVRIPWDKPIPYDLIAALTRFRVDEIKEQQ